MLKLKSFMLLFLFLTVWSQLSHACSCAHGGRFADYAKEATVIKGKISNYGSKLGHGETLYQDMEVEIIEVIQGEFTHKSVNLLGDPGHLCRPYIDSKKYIIDSTFLIALRADASVQPFLGCGESAVLLKDETIYGQDIVDGKYQPYTTDLKTLKVELRRASSTEQ